MGRYIAGFDGVYGRYGAYQRNSEENFACRKNCHIHGLRKMNKGRWHSYWEKIKLVGVSNGMLYVKYLGYNKASFSVGGISWRS